MNSTRQGRWLDALDAGVPAEVAEAEAGSEGATEWEEEATHVGLMRSNLTPTLTLTLNSTLTPTLT